MGNHAGRVTNENEPETSSSTEPRKRWANFNASTTVGPHLDIYLR